MGVQQDFYSTDGQNKTFPSTKHIATKQHMAVWLRQKLDTVEVQLDPSKYELITNAAVLNLSPSTILYDRIEIRVADSLDELMSSPSAISVVAGIAEEVVTVAGIKSEVVTVADDTVALNLVADDLTKGIGTNQPTDSAILNALTNATQTQADVVLAAASANEAAASAASVNNPAQTITELLSFDTSVGYVNVLGYHTANDGGGGIFNYDSTIDKSTANGGTSIDPSVSLALQGTGVGFGCWVRQYSGAVNVKWFGAVGEACSYAETSNSVIEILEDTEILIPSYFSTLQKAIDLVKTINKIDLMIETSHILSSGIVCGSGVYNNFKISSVDAIVYVDSSFSSGVVVATNSYAPVLNCLIDLTGSTSFNSYTVTQNSYGTINPYCGVINGSGRGLYAENVSNIYADYAIFTGFQEAGCHCSRTSSIQCSYANFSGNSLDVLNEFGALYASRTSRIHGADMDVTNSGGYGIRAQRLAEIACPAVDVSYATKTAFLATLAGKIYSSADAPTANNISAGAVVVQDGGLVCFGEPFTFSSSTSYSGTAVEVRGAGSSCVCDGVTISGFTGNILYAAEAGTISAGTCVITSGLNGLYAERASKIQARSSIITNMTGNGVFADRLGVIEINDASITGSVGSDIACSRGSLISASACSTTNSVGTPLLADTNLTGGFNFANNGNRGFVWN